MTRSAKDTSVGADRPAAEHADSLRVDLPRYPLAPSIGAGLRSRLGSVDVDSGTMVIATGEFPDGGEWAAPCVADGALWSATGYGDGTYPVVALVDSDGNLRSVEVVFFSLALEAAARRAVDDELGWVPAKEIVFAYYSGTTEQSLRTAVGRYLHDSQRVQQRVWDEGITAHHPSVDSQPEVIGVVEVGGRVAVGDPCYGYPSHTVALPSGPYLAVVWRAEAGAWGNRVARMGLYSTGTACSRPDQDGG